MYVLRRRSSNVHMRVVAGVTRDVIIAKATVAHTSGRIGCAILVGWLWQVGCGWWCYTMVEYPICGVYECSSTLVKHTKKKEKEIHCITIFFC